MDFSQHILPAVRHPGTKKPRAESHCLRENFWRSFSANLPESQAGQKAEGDNLNSCIPNSEIRREIAMWRCAIEEKNLVVTTVNLYLQSIFGM